MRRLQSIKLKVKRSTSTLAAKTGIDDGKKKTHSISTVLALAVDPGRPGPTSQELHTVATYTRRGEAECLKLKRLMLEHLTLSENTHRYTEVLKLLTVLDYVFVSGAREFYYIFVNGDAVGDVGQGVWKLKALDNTLAGTDPNIERIRNKIAELLWICADHDHWRDRRRQYQAIRQEIHLPTSRRSFEVPSSTSLPSSPPPIAPPQGVRRAHTVHSSFPSRSSSSLYRKVSLDRIKEED